jgi:nucleotide-binding universal stress UspA family protein
MFQRVLVPLDGSPRAEQALPVAARIARASGGAVVLLQVVYSRTPLGEALTKSAVDTEAELEAEVAKVTTYLAKVAASADLEGIGVKTEVRLGEVAPTILSFTRVEGIDLVVICSHGETGFKRWTLGSIAQKVARHCTAPVLVLHEGGLIPIIQPNATRPLRALVALDSSHLAETVLKPAAHLVTALSAPARAELNLVQVLTMPAVYGRLKSQAHIDPYMAGEEQRAAKAYLSQIAERLHKGELAHLNLAVTTSTIVDADVASALMKIAEHGERGNGETGTDGYDLVAVATHGRSGWQRWAMGSVAERILGGTRLPLLVVRPEKEEAEHGLDVEETTSSQEVIDPDVVVAEMAVFEVQSWTGFEE